MKKRNYKLLLPALLAVLFFQACTHRLDVKPDNLLTFDMLWQTRADAESYLYQIYGYIATPADDYTVLGASDETSCPTQGVNVRKMISGTWNAQSDYWHGYWTNAYSAIRQSFVFEQNIGKVPSSQLSDALKSQYKSEALFLRGWFYWKLLRQYGPFVKLDNTLGISDDFNKYPRAPFDTCVAAINTLMDQAAAGLPDSWTSSANLGRPTKGSCLAVKSQLALLAASPLWNGNPNFSSFKNKDGSALVSAQYDAGKWKTAAAAAKAVIDLNVYKLFTNLDEGDAQLDPLVSFRDLFLTNSNAETIFSSNLPNGDGSWEWGLEIRCAPAPAGYNMQNATQNVVDAFYMRNGRTIDDTQSGYMETGYAQSDDPAQWGLAKDGINRGYVKGNSNMYVNREARFYASIQYNGKPVTSALTTDDRNYFSSTANQDGTGRIEFYYSGKSGVSTTSSVDMSGYDVLKNISPASNIRTGSVAYRPYIHLRYAEILLNYVEALNEYDPSNPDIITYLDMIRTRAGLPGLEAVYPDAVGDQEAMRKWILRERQVELCFEGDRYFTLVRRKLMNDNAVQSIYRMNVGANDNGQGFSFDGYYTRSLLQTRYWDEKMYLFPIAQSDIDNDNSIVQNPGW